MRDKVCTKIASLAKSVTGLSQLIGREYEEELEKKVAEIVEKYDDHEYVCGLENTVNLFENSEIKQVIIKKINGILQENGHNGIASKENINFRNGSKDPRIIGGIFMHSNNISNA